MGPEHCEPSKGGSGVTKAFSPLVHPFHGEGATFQLCSAGSVPHWQAQSTQGFLFMRGQSSSAVTFPLNWLEGFGCQGHDASSRADCVNLGLEELAGSEDSGPGARLWGWEEKQVADSIRCHVGSHWASACRVPIKTA